MIPALIGAAAAIGSSLITNQYNKDNAIEGYSMQKDYNQWLLRNQTQEKVKDLRSAGLNPAFMNGSQLGSTPSPPSYTPPSASSPFDLSSAMMFGRTAAETSNLQANTRKTLADAKAQELLNKDKEAYNREIGKTTSVSYTDNNNVPIGDLDQWITEHPNEIPNQLVITQFGKDGSTGKFNAEQAKKRWSGEVVRIDANIVMAKLDEMVASGQSGSPEVLNALINMPYKTFSKLVQDTKNAVTSGNNLEKQGEILDIDKVTKQLEQDITRDSNLLQYVEKAFNKDFSLKDVAKLMVLAVVAGLKR